MRTSVDLRAYEHRARQGPCFICAFLAGHPDFSHAVVFEDDEHVAFLDRWPTLPGKVLVAPRAHVEHVVRELDEAAYLRLMCLVRRVACAVERVFAPERTYLLSLGSQEGNSHLHWHVAGLPPGVPYGQQQFFALMAENGVLEITPQQFQEVASQLRDALAADA